jgi:DNA-binding response OmpR family regulator
MPVILIVEDDDNMAYGLQVNLEFEGFHVVLSKTGEGALEFVRTCTPDLILLDLMLPVIQGLEVLQVLREEGCCIPIIVLSAKVNEMDKVAALRSGAGDYVTKPFSLMELVERVKLRLQCTRRPATRPNRPSHLAVDLSMRSAHANDEPIALAPKEMDLLAELIRADGRVLSREYLLKQVWRTVPNLNTHTVDVHVGRLRSKLKVFGLDNHIVTTRSAGFRWIPSNRISLIER